MTDEERRALKSASYRIANFESDVHFMPQDDWFEHNPDVNCACHPFLDAKNSVDMKRGLASKYVWVHRRIKDNRELLS